MFGWFLCFLKNNNKKSPLLSTPRYTDSNSFLFLFGFVFGGRVFIFSKDNKVDSLSKKKEGRKIWRMVQIFLLLYTSMALLLEQQKKV